MFLRSLEIKNYRSLEHVKLEGLSRFNVLIGRNNSGKSAVLGALALLNNSIRASSVDWETVLTDKNKTRSLEMCLLTSTPHPHLMISATGVGASWICFRSFSISKIGRGQPDSKSFKPGLGLLQAGLLFELEMQTGLHKKGRGDDL